MGQTLTHGIYLPDEGERNCYDGLAGNWQLLDGAVGTIAEHTAALAGKAADADVVHKTGNETIAGNKAFSNNIDRKSTSYEIGTTPASDASLPINFKDKNDTSVGWIRSLIKSSGDTIVEIISSNKFKNGALDTTGTQKYYGMTVGIDNTGNPYHQFSGKLKQSELPFTDSTYDLGSSSYQWNNLYAKNYYYNGTAWGLDKENVWSSSNRFTKSINLGSITSYTDCSMGFTGLYNVLFFNTRGSTNIPSYGTYLYYGYSNVSPDRGAIIRMVRTTDKRGNTNDGYIPDTSFNLYKISPEKLFIDFMEAVRVTNDGTENSLKPITNNATDLGTSTNKWKSFNGTNPGALSLPDYSNAQGLDVSAQGLNWDLTGATSNSYTPTFDGYLSLRCKDTNGDFLFAAYGGNNAIIRNCAVGTGILPGNAGLCLLIPILASTPISIQAKATTNFKAYVIPCFGNV